MRWLRKENWQYIQQNMTCILSCGPSCPSDEVNCHHGSMSLLNFLKFPELISYKIFVEVFFSKIYSTGCMLGSRIWAFNKSLCNCDAGAPGATLRRHHPRQRFQGLCRCKKLGGSSTPVAITTTVMTVSSNLQHKQLLSGSLVLKFKCSK